MPAIKPAFTIIKRNANGLEVLRYSGAVILHARNSITLEAYFNHADVQVVRSTLKRGDRFIETFYMDRWYNILEIHDREDDRLKGWYCNIGKPAELESAHVLSYVDLALDLWVAPDGTQTVLDEDEFTALDLDAESRTKARAALAELQAFFL